MMKRKPNLALIFNRPRWTSEIDIALDHLEMTLARQATNMSPPYQRGHVWTREQQESFMGHMLEGGEVLPIIFQQVPDSGFAEVLDGKQRITAMLCWLHGECAARLSDGTRVFIGDLEVRQLPSGKTTPIGLSRITVRARYINLPFEERKRFYARLNSAGTPHTVEEIEAALCAKETETT